MMATTHVFAGVSVAALVTTVAPEVTPAAVVAVAAICGGFAPDLDLPADHRKTLHFPVYYAGCALAAGVAALVVPTTVTVALAMFFLAAALHCVMDAAGGGLEFKPWEGTSEQAVYDHYHGRWIRPRRWIRYDGAPEDLLLASALAVPGLIVFDGPVRDLLVVLLVVSVGYTAIRKPLVVVGEWLLPKLPPRVLAVLPERILPIEDGALEERSD
ncbi:metal-dependent hydrolase [Natronorubrum sp. JWXQ-INN-674]|uniref:Metal-dependent hydrolase n=1 Tax=Natronorubrum halalkaliphilum TaxID=2691917 RepID=A0A6B0VKA2_9EURY|nr:metal-dependent hydrolase [Natronorubrum halalkaliphilum]MXV61958.1 metal-dependent hydrolase [Natronorubrum halalkaliphilum]